MPRKMRLLSFLMKSGRFGSARQAAAAIESGNVLVNGRPLTVGHHSIKVRSNVVIRTPKGDVPLTLRENIYIIINKPAGYVCQKGSKDDKSIYELFSKIKEIDEKARKTLFTVGRLDKDTTGLLVVTNDGQLEKLLTLKEHSITKTYLVKTQSPITQQQLHQLTQGVTIYDDDSQKQFLVKAVSTSLIGPCVLEVSIDEGRKRQVKKMMRQVQSSAKSLERVAIGNLRMDDVGFGSSFYKIVDLDYLKKRIGFS